MDNNRRLVLALALVVVVVVLTNILFPSAPAKNVPAKTTATPTASATTPSATTPSASPSAAPNAAPTVGAATADAAAPAPAAAPVESITVAGAKAAYTLSTAGGSLVSARMLGYKSLATPAMGGGEPVDIAPAKEALLAYRIVVPGDTLVLSRTTFTKTVTGNTVQLDGAAQARSGAAVPVQIVYSFVPDSFVAHVRGTVTGVTGPAFLLVDMPQTLRVTEKDTLDHFSHLAYAWKPQTRDAKSTAFSRIDPGEKQIVPGPLTWAVAKSKYFLVGALAQSDAMPFTELDVQGGVRTTKLATRANATLVQSLANGGFAFDLYAGPQEWRHLASMKRDFENANPYGGWTQGIVQPFATLVIRALLWMHDHLALSYGWVLIVFGIAVRLVLWPLQQGAMRSQLKMQRVQPELQLVQERYKNDPQKLQAEMMKVYAAHGMSPFSPLAGCLPMLIPLPIFFALFFVFQNTIEFRGVPFLWMHDISQHDPYFILPILVAATQFLMSWIGMRGAPPNPQAKMLGYVMPAMFLVFFIKMAAGLNLYYLTQNLIMLPQQWLLANERQKNQGKPIVQGTPTKQGSPLRNR